MKSCSNCTWADFYTTGTGKRAKIDVHYPGLCRWPVPQIGPVANSISVLRFQRCERSDIWPKDGVNCPVWSGAADLKAK